MSRSLLLLLLVCAAIFAHAEFSVSLGDDLPKLNVKLIDNNRLWLSMHQDHICDLITQGIHSEVHPRAYSKRGEEVSFTNADCRISGDDRIRVEASIGASAWRQGWTDLLFGGWTWITPRVSVSGRAYTGAELSLSGGSADLRGTGARVQIDGVLGPLVAGILNPIIDGMQRRAVDKVRNRIFPTDRVREGLDRVPNSDMRKLITRLVPSNNHHLLTDSAINRFKDTIATKLSLQRRGSEVGFISEPLDPMMAAFVGSIRDL